MAGAGQRAGTEPSEPFYLFGFCVYARNLLIIPTDDTRKLLYRTYGAGGRGGRFSSGVRANGGVYVYKLIFLVQKQRKRPRRSIYTVGFTTTHEKYNIYYTTQ